ncbi:MAG: aminotransferase class I/II-fold pyridoxal phosphate-dependent enzyme, partial [Gemmatimonadetes bacterium]|nr:aminotransferase class I/II-fold pyridoxal phosphate-dependent enzyme [Gemmatimonadota bacterium]
MVVGEDVGDITRSAISAPLLHEGRVLGAISAQSYRSKAYGAEDLELLQGIADIAAVAEVLRGDWLTQGPAVREFEAAFAERVGAAEAVATTSCTTALQLALHVSGVGPGDEVIVPSLSFIATANSVWHCGATPVFADIDPDTYNLDPAAAERAISRRTKAIMPVHQVGLPADMDAFLELGERYGVVIVE